MDSNISSAEMVYGTALTLPAQPLSPEETPSVAVKQQGAGRAIPTRELPQQAPTEVPTHLATAEMVYVKKGGQAGPLAPPYSGPYKGPKYFNMDIGGQPQAITVDRLKPHTGGPTQQGAAPGGKAASTNSAPQPSQEDTFPGPASYH